MWKGQKYSSHLGMPCSGRKANFFAVKASFMAVDKEIKNKIVVTRVGALDLPEMIKSLGLRTG